MLQHHRREFLTDVGTGMLVAGIGSGLVSDLGLGRAKAEETTRLTFDKLEPLVSLMQETPLPKLIPALVAKVQNGTELKTLIAAGALANARTFGGQDYTGYHAFMALPPALEMSKELPAAQKAIPVLKVLYRNSSRIQAHGGTSSEVLHPIHHEPVKTASGETLREFTRKADMAGAEAEFARTFNKPETAYDALQYAIQDEVDVHRVVLAWRAWTMLDITGINHAHTILRQSVRYCVDSETKRLDGKRAVPGIRTLLPKLLDENKLAGKTAGTKQPDDAWVNAMAETIYSAGRDRAAEAVAMALAEGIHPEAIGEAMSLAASLLVLRDPGRTKDEEGKPKGSVHGASVGVHASDSANAWRNIARISSARNTFASLIVGAYHTAGQHLGQNKQAQPMAESLLKVTKEDAPTLLSALTKAVTAKDQTQASAIAYRYNEAGHPVKDFFNVLLGFAVSEDGALHAEKYYRTIREEYTNSRKAFRGNHLIALARVTASEYGFPAPGYSESCQLLKG